MTQGTQPPVKMRKKPAQARSATTVEAIVEAAAQILSADGEEAVTTGAVAARAGVSIGSLYQYFPNRDAVLAALIHRERQAIAAEIMREIETAAPDTLEIAARRIARALIAVAARRRGKAKLFQLIPTIGPTADGDGIELRQRIAGMILRSAREGGLAPLTPAAVFVLTRSILGAVAAATIENSDHLDEPDFEDALTRLAVSFLRG